MNIHAIVMIRQTNWRAGMPTFDIHPIQLFICHINFKSLAHAKLILHLIFTAVSFFVA